jgi:hypothetical protein
VEKYTRKSPAGIFHLLDSPCQRTMKRMDSLNRKSMTTDMNKFFGAEFFGVD